MPDTAVHLEQDGYEYYAALSEVKIEKGFNIRQDTVPDAELVNSVKETGVLMPITVRTRAGKKGLWVIDGERRYRAAKKAKADKIPVNYIGEPDDNAALLISLTTKSQRAFTDNEVSAGFKRLTNGGMTADEVAGVVGCHPRTVVEAIRVMDKATEKLKAANAPTRVTSRAATLPAKVQDVLAPQIEGKSREEGLKAVRKAEKDLGKNTRGRKPNEYPMVKKAKDVLEQAEKLVLQKLDYNPKDKYYKGMRDMVDIMKGSQTIDSVFHS
jgi:ParB family chromosome partitioning protein